MSRLLCLTELLRPTSHPRPKTTCAHGRNLPADAGTPLAYRDLALTCSLAAGVSAPRI